MDKDDKEPTQDKDIDPSVLYDTQFIRKHLDSAVSKVLTNCGYEERRALYTTKMLLGTAAIVAAVVSHFVLKDFRAQYWYMVACIAFWLVAYQAIIAIDMYYCGSLHGALHIGFNTRDERNAPAGKKRPKWIAAQSKLESFSSKYELTLRAEPRRPHMRCTETIGYNTVFTADGKFLEDKLEHIVRRAVARVELQHRQRRDRAKKIQ